MDAHSFPDIPTELVEALEKRYPDKKPDGVFNYEEELVNVGIQRVVRQLRILHNAQHSETEIFNV